MMDFGRALASVLTLPCVVELRGDVGVGKTTFVRGLAAGLGIAQPITSPSFTISKRYALPKGRELVHYDFYRLDDPGLMSSELADTISQPNSLVLIEWGGGVRDLLPDNTIRLNFTLQDDNSRLITTDSPLVQSLWKTCGKNSETCGKTNKSCVQTCGKLPKTAQTSSQNDQKSVQNGKNRPKIDQKGPK